ncbi:hypothetical protein [Micromonospora sp. CPCC 206061]|uniref:hypothetical protein n=1 Tax=Micromonospora sp. CPCC 206061 TaxID=3122410 RepID=UPI002FF29D04
MSHVAWIHRDNVTGEVYYPPIEMVADSALSDPTLLPLPLALLLIAPLIGWPATGTRRPLPWLLGVPVAAILLPTDYEVTLGWQPWATFVAMVGFLVWMAVDARATMAAGVLILPLILALVTVYARGGLEQPETLTVVSFGALVIGAVTLLTVGAFGLRRQAQL